VSLKIFGARRAVALDIASESVKSLVVERRGKAVRILGVGLTPVPAGSDPSQLGQAIHSSLARAGAHGEPVIAAVGGPEVVIRQVLLPSLPPARILGALSVQHREFGLLPPEEGIIDAQVLRRPLNGGTTDVLAVSAPRKLVEERTRLLEQASVRVQTIDVEPLALLNGALHLSGVESGELLVAVTIEWQRTVLCLLSDHGPVVVRYLSLGAEDLLERLRVEFEVSPFAAEEFARTLNETTAARAEETCRDILERVAEDIRLSLAFYRSEYDRESLPRYVLCGWTGLSQIGRWLSVRVGVGTPFELLDPLQSVDVKTMPGGVDPETQGPLFVQAFGLALRGL
jgi:type IV pilus assembly protein PilM